MLKIRMCSWWSSMNSWNIPIQKQIHMISTEWSFTHLFFILSLLSTFLYDFCKISLKIRTSSWWSSIEIIFFSEAIFHSSYWLMNHPYIKTIHMISTVWSITPFFLLNYHYYQPFCIIFYWALYHHQY